MRINIKFDRQNFSVHLQHEIQSKFNIRTERQDHPILRLFYAFRVEPI